MHMTIEDIGHNKLRAIARNMVELCEGSMKSNKMVT